MKTPCIGVCSIVSGICQGCGRSLKQIRDWGKYTDAQRERICAKLAKEVK